MPAGSDARRETEPWCARNMRSQNCISVNDAIVTMIGAATRQTSRTPPGLGREGFRMEARANMVSPGARRQRASFDSRSPWLDR